MSWTGSNETRPSQDDTRPLETAIDTNVRVGPYRLIRELGRGGMGTVYLAVRSDDAFQKRVALKILRRGTDTEAVVRRFRHERQILASLEHPNIAGLLDGGATQEGLPYFAMEYVEGQSIVEYAEAQPLETTARLELFRKVCGAVHYAHQNLIIHRDLKPANVLVTPDGEPKLLDFGIAKLVNPELGGATLAATVAGLQLMTPEYASPEQVRGEAVTTATDVYSLGVLLYELLTGRRPYQLPSRAPDEIARVVCHATPVRPSTAVTSAADAAGGEAAGQGVQATPSDTAGINRARAADHERLSRRLAGDLDTIVMKALSKEPGRRYASVDQFSEDIRRHLSGLPVIARKDTLGYRVAKFVGRNRVSVAGAAALIAALIAGIVGTSWQARVARAERARAEQRFNDVRQLATAFLFDVHDAVRDLPGSTPARQLMVSKGLEYLDKLSRDSADRLDLQRELARAYLKVGDVQGRPFNPNLGDTAGAQRSYGRAVTLYEALAARADPDPALQGELATAYLRLSEILSSTGDTQRALQLARKSVAAQQAAATPTAAPQARLELAASHSRVGDLLSSTGDTRGALEERRRALALMQTLFAAAPTDVATIRQLGVGYQKLGNSLGNPNYPNIGDYQAALEQLERASTVFRDGAAAHPTNALFRRNGGIVDSNIADVLQALKRPDEALARQRRALTVFEALVVADSTNVAASNDVAISRSKIAEMLDAAGRPREALPEFEKALAAHLGLAASDPANRSFKLEVASDHNRLATVQAKLGLHQDSLAHHDSAVTMSRDLSAANLDNVELRVAVALAHAGRGDAYVLFANAGGASRAGDLADAERDYREAVAIMESLKKDGSIQGTDVVTLDAMQKELARIRLERSRPR